MNPVRFVILHHLSPTGEHWDLMIEREDALATWQLLAEPTGPDACPIDCIRIKDHRKHYLHYEGPISGGRGIVERIDAGAAEILAADESSWTLRLSGERLIGDFALKRVEDSTSRWTFDVLQSDSQTRKPDIG